MIQQSTGNESGTLRRRAGKIALWALTVLVAMFFVSVGAPKLAGGATEQFVGWGYPAWFSYVIGTIEVGGAALLLFPRLAAFAAALLCANMVGAVFTELVAGGGTRAILPLVLLALLGIVGLVRRGDLAWSARTGEDYS